MKALVWLEVRYGLAWLGQAQPLLYDARAPHRVEKWLGLPNYTCYPCPSCKN